MENLFKISYQDFSKAILEAKTSRQQFFIYVSIKCLNKLSIYAKYKAKVGAVSYLWKSKCYARSKDLLRIDIGFKLVDKKQKYQNLFRKS